MVLGISFCVFSSCLKLDVSDLSNSENQLPSSPSDDDSDDDTDDDSDDDEDDEDSEDTTVTEKYSMHISWNESSYGKWDKYSDFKVKVKSSSVTITNTLTKLEKEGGIISDVDKKVESSVSTRDTSIYTRTKISKLEDYDEEDYKNMANLMLFVDSVSTTSDVDPSYKYTFSSPVPLIPRNDQSKKKYNSYLGKTYKYEYSIHDSVFDKDVSFEYTCKFSSEGSNKIKVVLTNEITTTDWKNNSDKRKADLYGRFPIFKKTTYIIDTNDRQIVSIEGEHENLISKEQGESRYNIGNIAPVTISAE